MTALHHNDTVDRMDPAEDADQSMNRHDEENKDHCVICLHEWEDKSVLETCQHAFCFKCLFQWAMVSRSCPLCVRPFESCIHLIVSDSDYTLYHFEPLETNKSKSPRPSSDTNAPAIHPSTYGVIRQLYGPPQLRPRFPHQRRRYHQRPPRPETAEEQSVAEQQRKALMRRIRTYRQGLYVKHIGANRISRYQQITPETFQVFPARLDRLAPWIRRDLQAIAWLLRTGRGGEEGGGSNGSSSLSTLLNNADEMDHLHDEFAPGLEVVREYILAVMKQYDLQTDQALDLLRGFLHEYTEHFVHELMAYARSPFSVEAYDQVAQYGSPTLAQTTRASSTPTFRDRSRSRELSARPPRGDKSNRSKRRRDSLSDEERLSRRHDRHGKAVDRHEWDGDDKKDPQGSSSAREAESSSRPSRISGNEGSSGGLSSLRRASSSTTSQQDRRVQIQQLIREKYAREQAIYEKNHPS